MTSRSWTIREVLDWATRDFAARGIQSPRLDAELLVASALGIDRVGLYLDLNRPLLPAERGAIRPLVARRREREPVAYILGHRDFYGRRFEVTPDVLIPRPDTETLVEHALEQIPSSAPSSVIDVGTGSGAIAITLAVERPAASVTATDVSEGALRVAARNADAHSVGDRIRFARADLFPEAEIYELVVSNPPYVSTADLAELEDDVRLHEPTIALEAGEDGLAVIRRLLERAARSTRAGAQMLFEIGAGQAAAVAALIETSVEWDAVAIHTDLNKVERVVHLRRT